MVFFQLNVTGLLFQSFRTASPIPVSLATPPRPMPSSPKTTPISQKTATTAPSTNPTSSPDSAHSSRRKQKTAIIVHT